MFYSNYISQLLTTKTLAVIGRGFLSDSFQSWNWERIQLGLKPFKFLTLEEFLNLPQDSYFDYFVNCLANTNVRGGSLEDHMRLNYELPRIMAAEAKLYGGKFVHISSADIYKEGENLNEDSPIALDSLYYASKWLGEKNLDHYMDNCIVMRPRLLYNDILNKKNLIYKLDSYEKMFSLKQSVTCTETLIAAILFLLDNNHSGIFNVADENPINFSDYYPQKIIHSDLIPQPKSIILNCEKLKQTGFQIFDSSQIFTKNFQDFQNSKLTSSKQAVE